MWSTPTVVNDSFQWTRCLGRGGGNGFGIVFSRTMRQTIHIKKRNFTWHLTLGVHKSCLYSDKVWDTRQWLRVSSLCVMIKLINLDLFDKNSDVFASRGSSACTNLPSALMVLLIRVRLSSLMVFFTSILTLMLRFNK